MRSRLKAAAVLIGVALCGVLPAAAAADGDPASDYLLAQNVYYPFSPAVAQQLQRALNAETTTAAHDGFPIKVAIIDDRFDLGAVTMLLGYPQTYARFLEREIDFNGKQPLLVVMADGYGVQGLPRASTTAAQRLLPPRGATSNDLATAALIAVSKLAAADGHHVTPDLPISPPTSSAGSPLVWLAAAAPLLAAAILYARTRRSAVIVRRRKHRP